MKLSNWYEKYYSIYIIKNLNLFFSIILFNDSYRFAYLNIFDFNLY